RKYGSWHDGMIQRQPCAGAQHQRLKQKPGKSCACRKPGIAIAGKCLLAQHADATALPMSFDGRLHPHGPNDIGMLHDVFGERESLPGRGLSVLYWLPGNELIQESK